ncbi:MAG: hypothetical protein GF408_04315 [Candidatus Omnitrophica bacterium]|nr:hypothetical protein [Candidatus Omnitrophota bacterium]
MHKIRKNIRIKGVSGFLCLLLVLSFSTGMYVWADEPDKPEIKLYWFIPDGMRADPYVFNIYRWACEGKLPNIKKMMEEGTYGFCKPVYPGHTPVNFATLFTGSNPYVHGVSDGPMHTEGNPLTRPSVAGFRSTAKKVEPIWVTLEEQGKRVALLSIPGSTPPELDKGYTVVGRWGGWGANFYAVNFEDIGKGDARREQGRHARLFFFGPPLAVFTGHAPAGDPAGLLSYSVPREADLSAWGKTVRALMVDTSDDNKVNYDKVVFLDGETVLAELKEGQWSGWVPLDLEWNGLQIGTSARIKVIKLEDNGFFRIRVYYNALNETVSDPSYLASQIIENIGPMVDYADNFPPQLIFYEEDKDTFLEEAVMSFDWHRDAVGYFINEYDPDVLIQDIYTPNQMLTSRWWMGYVDPTSPLYNKVSDNEREILWEEVRDMYKRLDAIVGEYLKNADENTIVALSSDHGAIPLYKWVNLNNLFAEKGWLKFTIDPVTGEPSIDWVNSRVVYLNFGQVHVNPDGLHDADGNWHRASGPAYESLREEVKDSIRYLEDEDGIRPLMRVSDWETAEEKFGLPGERVGDIIIANRPGYGWSEKVTKGMEVFSTPLKSGYKQAIIPDDLPGMWTPFMLKGPGVKKGCFLGDQPVDMIDQYPTLMKLLGAETPGFVEGRPIGAALEKPE